MKTLLTFVLCLFALVANAANPSTKSFRATGGLVVTSNDITGIITYDGSGISSPTGGVSAATVTNIVTSYIGSSSNAFGYGMTNLLYGQTVFVDATNGNNATAMRGDFSKPYRSVSNAAAVLQSGDVLEIRPGIYPVTPSVVQSNGLGAINIFNKTNITIRGAAGGLSILDAGATLGTLVYVTNASGFTMRDVTLKGYMLTNYVLYEANYVWGAFEMFKCDNLLIENCKFIDHFDHGIIDFGFAIANLSTNNIIIRNNIFDNIGSSRTNASVEIDGTAVSGSSWTIEYNYMANCFRAIEPYSEPGTVFNRSITRGNVIRNCIESAITTAGSTNGHNLLIENNHIFWDLGYSRRGTNPLTSADGIVINGGQRHKVLNNTIINAPNYGIQCITDAEMFGHVIEGNKIQGQFSDANGLGIGVMRVTGGGNTLREFSIKNNQISGKRFYGILADFLRDSVVDGNRIVNCGTNGSYYALGANQCSNVVFSGNVVINNGGASATAQGMLFNGTSGIQAVTLIGNQIYGVTTNIAMGTGAGVKFIQQADNTGIVRNDVTNSFTWGSPVAGQVLTAIDSTGKATWSNVVAGAGGSITTNGNQFLGVPLSIKDGAVLTNIDLFGSLNVGDFITDSRVLVTDGSSDVIGSSVTSTELGFLTGATSSIQNQLNAKGNFSTNADGSANFTSGPGTESTIVLFGTNGVGAMAFTLPGNFPGTITNRFNFSNAAPGQVLTVVSSNNNVITWGISNVTASAGATALSNLTDVAVENRQAGDTIQWYPAMQKWSNYAGFFNIQLTVVQTNIFVGSNMEQQVTITTNSSFQLVFTGTPNNGEIVHVSVSNYSASTIYGTNTFYDTSVASNVTVFAVAPTSIRKMTFVNMTNHNLGSSRWELRNTLGLEPELAAGTNVVFTTNGNVVSVNSASGSGSGNFSTNANGVGVFNGLNGRVQAGNNPTTVTSAVFMATPVITNHAIYSFLDIAKIEYVAGGTIGHASFDAGPTITGTVGSDHHNAFQDATLYTNSGVLARYSGVSIAPRIAAGTVSKLMGYEFVQPTGSVGVTGGVTTVMGVYVPSLTMGSASNYAYYADPPTISYLGGGVGIGSPLRPTGAPKFWLADTNQPRNSRGNLYVYTTDTAAIDKGGYLVLGASYTGGSETAMGGIVGAKENVTAGNIDGYLGFFANQNGVGMGNEKMRLSSLGKLAIGTNAPNAFLHVAGNSTGGFVIQAGTTNRPSALTLDTNGALVLGGKLTASTNLASFNFLTNDFVSGQVYTNDPAGAGGGQRAFVQATATLTNILSTDVAIMALWVDQDGDGSFESKGKEVLYAPVVALSSNQEILCSRLQPNARFAFTNLSTGTASSGIRPNSSEIVRE